MKAVRNKALIQLISAYCLFLLLPIILGTVLIVSFYANNVEREYLQKSVERLEEIDNNISTTMKAFSSTVGKIRRDNNLAVYKLRKNTYYWWTAQQELTRYLSASPYLLDLVYYDSQTDTILSGSNSYSRDLFYTTYYEDSDITQEALWGQIDESKMESISIPLFVTKYENRSIFTYSFVLPSAGGPRSAKMLILVDTQTLMSQMAASLPTENSTVFVLDTNQQPLLSTGPVSEMLLSAAKSAIAGEDRNRSLEVSRLDGFLSATTPSVPSWHYFLFTPKLDVTRQINMFLFVLLGAEALVLLASVLFFGYNIKYYYKPLRSLGDIVRSQSRWNAAAKSEFEVISEALSEISHLRQEVVSNEEAALRLLLVQLLLGRSPDGKGGNGSVEGRMQLFPEGWDLDSEDNYFCLILMVCASGENGRSALSAVVPQRLSSLFVEDIGSGGLLVLCPFDGRRDALLNRLCQAQSAMIENGVQAYAYISRTYRSIFDTSQVYREVSNTASRQSATRENPICYCDREVDSSQPIDSYPAELLFSFRQALGKSDGDGAQEALSKVIHAIQREECSVSYAQFLCYDVIYSILYIFHEKGRESAGDEFIRKVENMLNIRSKDELLQHMESVRDLLKRQAVEEDGYDKQAIRYMQQHFYEPDFSIQKVAEQLGVTASHLSRLFKGAVGYTLIDYVNQLRIEKAKSLLETTEEPLSDIVQQIGYLDVSSFHKRFKTHVGMTPGAYRAQFKK